MSLNIKKITDDCKEFKLKLEEINKTIEFLNIQFKEISKFNFERKLLKDLLKKKLKKALSIVE